MKNSSLPGICNFLLLLAISLVGLQYIQLSYFLFFEPQSWRNSLLPFFFNYPQIPNLFFLVSTFLVFLAQPQPLQKLFLSKIIFLKFFGLILCLLEWIFMFRLNSLGITFLNPLSFIGFFLLLRSFLRSNPEIRPHEEIIKIRNDLKKQVNEDSFNWKLENGYINLVNPFQGIFIVGGAGSGKTYTLIREIIAQSIQKKFTGFIYDYKYPELTEFALTHLQNSNPSKTKFYSVNFTEPHRSHRINPIHPRNLPISLFAQEFSSTILKNLKKEWVAKQDFWADNAISYLKAIIWFLKKKEPQCCTLPHAIILALNEYPEVLEMLAQDKECKSMISSLWTAFKENAGAQIAGCISSLQNPLDKLNNPDLFWILSGDDIPLNLNNPEQPALLCVGNNPIISDSLNPIISLIASAVIKNLNQRGNQKSIFLLDEAPTLYIPNLKDLPNTGRSNRISTIYCCQDYSQMDLMYGREEAKVLRASLGNQFMGMVNDMDTAEQISKIFGKQDQLIETQNQSSSFSQAQDWNTSKGISYSLREKEIVKSNAALSFPTGYFVGKITGTKHAYFAGKPIITPLKRDLPSETEFNNKPQQQNEFKAVIEWNYQKIQLEIEEILVKFSTP